MTLYAVGKIVGCFGIRGAVKVQPVTHSVERLTELKSVRVGARPEDAGKFTVSNVERRERIAVLTFAGIDTRTKAEEIVGHYVFVSGQQLKKPDEGSYFTDDIVGAEVYGTDGTLLGTIEDVEQMPAQDVWVMRSGEKSIMIPAVKEFIKSVDVKQRRIVIEVIEGLLDG
ncbi:MAG TPA: ribosome maturation factor RimM [Bacteroidota bacterium]|nr:ribosome maturation factor RimM [Bacteroidota bacterium]